MQHLQNGLDKHFLDRFFFFFNNSAAAEIYTLSLHDALPIYRPDAPSLLQLFVWQEYDLAPDFPVLFDFLEQQDRKSTRLNSSHVRIPYAVFCLKKKIKVVREIFRRPFRSARQEIRCRPRRSW